MQERVCAGCGSGFVPSRKDQRHCSDGCRQRAKRDRQKPKRDKAVVARRPVIADYPRLARILTPEVLAVHRDCVALVESRSPVYFELPAAIATVERDYFYAPARPHGYWFYREEMYVVDEVTDQAHYVPFSYSLAEVLNEVEESIRPADRRLAVALPLAWRVGFSVGWLSALAVAQPDEARQGMVILTALVTPLLLSQKRNVSGSGNLLLEQ